jgi:hypothetical protein
MKPDERDRFIDTWLDDALRVHGAIEPRPGLEGRILANLRAESPRTARIGRWWPVLATAPAIVLIAGAIFMSRQHRHAPSIVVNHPSVPQSVRPDAHGSAPTLAAKVTRPHAIRKVGVSHRLEQFPSPQPLSEQERILARYVEQFPRDAALMAEARTEFFKQEMIEQEIPKQEIPPISDQPNP